MLFSPLLRGRPKYGALCFEEKDVTSPQNSVGKVIAMATIITAWYRLIQVKLNLVGFVLTQ